MLRNKTYILLHLEVPKHPAWSDSSQYQSESTCKSLQLKNTRSLGKKLTEPRKNYENM